jgi:hypothetical protein
MNRREELELVTSLPLLVEEVVADALSLMGDPNRKGGYFCLSRTNARRILLVTQIGEIDSDEKADKYRLFCQEKSIRLACWPDHVSSFQSRNESAEQYGGAILTSEYILSFSGFPELWDEACMLEVVRRDPRIKFTFERHTRIMRVSNNQFVTETFGGYHR